MQASINDGRHRQGAAFFKRVGFASTGPRMWNYHQWRFVLADGMVARIEAVPLPAPFDMVIQSWDMTFKDSDSSDYVVGQVCGAHKVDRYLLDQRRARLDLPGTKEAVKEMKKKWPRTGAILVEDKANGPAVIQELHHDIDGLIEVTPEGGRRCGPCRRATGGVRKRLSTTPVHPLISAGDRWSSGGPAEERR